MQIRPGIVEELERDLRREEDILQALERDLVTEHQAAQRLEQDLTRLRETLPEPRVAPPAPGRGLSPRMQTFVSLVAAAMVVLAGFGVGMGVEGRTTSDLQARLAAAELQISDLATVATGLSAAQAGQLGASMTSIREGRGWITAFHPVFLTGLENRLPRGSLHPTAGASG